VFVLSCYYLRKAQQQNDKEEKKNSNNKETSMSFAIVVLPVVLFTLRNGLL